MADKEGKVQAIATDALDFAGTNFDMSVFSPVDAQTPEEVTETEKIIDSSTEGATSSDLEETTASTVKEEGAEEVQEEIVATEDETDKTDDGEESSSSPGIYSSLANVLQDQGILSSLDPDTKINSAEDLINAFNTELEKREFADLTDDQKQYLTALRSGIPAQDVQSHMSLMQELSSIDEGLLEQNAELRVELIKEDFLRQGMSSERAEKLAKRSVEIGEDIQDAKEALNSLKVLEQKGYEAKIQAAKDKQAAEAKAFQDSLDALKKTVTETKEIIPGFKINEKQKDMLFEQMTKPVGKMGNQLINAVQKARMDNPVDFEIKLNYLFQVTKGFTDFSSIVKTAKSKAVEDLEKVVKSQNFKSPGGSGAVDETISHQAGNDFAAKLGEIL